MRVLFKAPGMLFFRRCFFVYSLREIQDKDGVKTHLIAYHGIRKNKETWIPLSGSVVRFYGIDKRVAKGSEQV